jgi:acyl carrier protein phosphodiesterase
MLGNLLGDFAKGNRWNQFDSRIHEGIRLHRQIDFYMDNHPNILQLSRELSGELPKVAPIAVDIIFDFLLAQKWRDFHPQPLNDFLDDFFAFHRNQKNIQLPETPFLLLRRLEEKRMLHQYADPTTIDHIANHIESRLSFETKLPTCRQVYEGNRDLFESHFQVFMQDVVNIFPTGNFKF